MESAIDLATLKLAAGQHDDRSNGLCLMEAVAWFSGEPHSDHPECTCPVLGAMGRGLNDCLPDDERQQLRYLIPLLVGTAGNEGRRTRRANMAADWIVRVYTPAWLELAGLKDKADALRSLPELTDTDAIASTQPTIDDARKASAAARAAARDAARAAARDAAWAAARDAAWAAAWDAAWAAARDAAWDAASAAARDAARAAASAAARAAASAAARAAASAAARDAAWDAAWAAARDAAWDAAWAAAWAAAKNNLLKTSVELRASALDLFRRMIDAE